MQQALSSLPQQDDLRGNITPLLQAIVEGIVAFRGNHLHEGTDYLDAINNGQKPLAVVSQCIDGRQPFQNITGLPLGKFIAPNSIAGFLEEYPHDSSAWASIYFGVKELGAPVIIKLGHTGCGGVKALLTSQLNPTKDANADKPLDPTTRWLQEAIPLTRRVIDANPGLDQEQLARALEEEMVRDGVDKLEHFLDVIERQGQLSWDKRPAVVGLLFEMHTAKIYHLLDSGEFKLLSETQAHGMHVHEHVA